MKKILATIKRKWTEYLLEVIVITIGILGAFTLNNWNENRKERIVEREYLESLRTELLANKEIARDQIDFSRFQETNAYLILKVISGDTVLNNSESVLVAMESVGWNQSSSYFQQNTWQELFSTGNMNLIQNKTLRKELSDLYREINFVMGFGDEWNSYNKGARRFLSGIIPVSTRIEIVNNLESSKYSGHLSNPPDFQLISGKIKRIQGLDGYLFDIATCRNAGTHLYQNIILKIEKVISQLDNELKTL